MKNLIKKGLAFTAAMILSFAVIGSNVYASDEVFDKDAAGNVFGAGQSVDIEAGYANVENELFAAGMNVSANNVSVDGSAFLAGQGVTMNNAEVGGSIFAAGNNVVIDAVANNNIWVAGNSISLGDNTSVKGAYVAGNSVIIGGEYEAIKIAGGTVTFNAVVSGDVEIEADTIVFGNDASVGGNLKVISNSDPSASDIVEGSYTYEEASSEPDTSATGDGNGGTVKAIGKVAGKAAIGAIIIKKLKSVVVNLFKYAVLAVVLAFVFKNNLSKSYEYATNKPAQFWGFGALILITFPIIALILCITVIGLPIAGLTTTFYILALCVARVFTFGSLVRELIFTHTKKRLNPIAETVLAVLPAAVIKVIPLIGGLVGFACAIYTIGYICLAICDNISANWGKEKTI